MNFYNENDKKRLSDILKKTGANEELFDILFATAKVPDGASIDHALAKVRYLLSKKILPALYLDKEQYAVPVDVNDDTETSEGSQEHDQSAYEYTSSLLEYIVKLRHQYALKFGKDFYADSNISLQDEIKLLEESIQAGEPFIFWSDDDSNL
jgi:hypothetical protein